MKILITGSSGLLGGHILKKLKKNKKNKIFHNGILKKKTDLSKEKNIEKFLLKNKIDLIINCAGYTNIDFIEEEKKRTDKINIDLLKIFFKVKKKHNLKFNLIHFSTDQLYGKKNIYHKETSKIFTFNHYCKQKILTLK